jgi:hypothetical protein
MPNATHDSIYEPRFVWKASRFTVGELAMFVFQEREEVDGPFTHPAEDLGFLIRILPELGDAILGRNPIESVRQTSPR